MTEYIIFIISKKFFKVYLSMLRTKIMSGNKLEYKWLSSFQYCMKPSCNNSLTQNQEKINFSSLVILIQVSVGVLHCYMSSIPCFIGVFSIDLHNMFSSLGFREVTRNCLLVAGRPVILSQSFILAALSWVTMWLECCAQILLCGDTQLVLFRSQIIQTITLITNCV